MGAGGAGSSPAFLITFNNSICFLTFALTPLRLPLMLQLVCKRVQPLSTRLLKGLATFAKMGALAAGGTEAATRLNHLEEPSLLFDL